MPILDDYQLQVMTQFRGVTLNSAGVLRELYAYIQEAQQEAHHD